MLLRVLELNAAKPSQRRGLCTSRWDGLAEDKFSWECLHLWDVLDDGEAVHMELRRLLVTQLTVRGRVRRRLVALRPCGASGNSSHPTLARLLAPVSHAPSAERNLSCTCEPRVRPDGLSVVSETTLHFAAAANAQAPCRHGVPLRWVGAHECHDCVVFAHPGRSLEGLLMPPSPAARPQGDGDPWPAVDGPVCFLHDDLRGMTLDDCLETVGIPVLGKWPSRNDRALDRRFWRGGSDAGMPPDERSSGGEGGHPLPQPQPERRRPCDAGPSSAGPSPAAVDPADRPQSPPARPVSPVGESDVREFWETVLPVIQHAMQRAHAEARHFEREAGALQGAASGLRERLLDAPREVQEADGRVLQKVLGDIKATERHSRAHFAALRELAADREYLPQLSDAFLMEEKRQAQEHAVVAAAGTTGEMGSEQAAARSFAADAAAAAADPDSAGSDPGSVYEDAREAQDCAVADFFDRISQFRIDEFLAMGLTGFVFEGISDANLASELEVFAAWASEVRLALAATEA